MRNLRWNIFAVGSSDVNCLWHAAGEVHARFHYVFACDIQWVEDDYRNTFGLGIQRRGDGSRSVAEHTRKLVHRDYIIVPGELVCLGSGSSGGDVVKMAAHYQRPGIVQLLHWIRLRT